MRSHLGLLSCQRMRKAPALVFPPPLPLWVNVVLLVTSNAPDSAVHPAPRQVCLLKHGHLKQKDPFIMKCHTLFSGRKKGSHGLGLQMF